MKNSECTIYIMFKGRWLQKFRKEKDVWTLTSSNGTIRPCTAEQLLSHILPPLAGIKGKHVTVKVEPTKPKYSAGKNSATGEPLK
ncbi:MAG: hypothetical protein NWE99_06640 [Candidatus Bathyarchaeota archaeon]|nr:hypothetical protein [Candidatus Bathyarchaeota archaeon]